MSKHTAQTNSPKIPTAKCYGCGHTHTTDDLRAFGTNDAGEPVTFVCADCDAAALAPQPEPVFVVTPKPAAAPAPKPQANRRAPTMLLTIPAARNWYPNHAAAAKVAK